MGSFIDKAKGKAKEMAGKATGDRKLEAEGIADQAKGKVKEKIEDVKDTAREELARDREALDSVTRPDD
jgi:uncharacterized protein YjbJ (UPF0337 family)